MTADLAAFVLAQLDADEKWLTTAARKPGHDPAFFLGGIPLLTANDELDRINALRTVVELVQATIQQGLVITGGAMLRVLAQPYRGRPGWRDEWGTG